MDNEAAEVLQWLPRRYDGRDELSNAYVFIDNSGRLNILPCTGGWLGLLPTDFDCLQGDVAPFSD